MCIRDSASTRAMLLNCARSFLETLTEARLGTRGAWRRRARGTGSRSARGADRRRQRFGAKPARPRRKCE
eukprot:161341-Alexandrium_andersonii.AAC.1